MKEKAKFEFENDFDYDKPIPENLGRLYFQDGSSISLQFTPKGMIAIVRMQPDSPYISLQLASNETQFMVWGTKG